MRRHPDRYPRQLEVSRSVRGSSLLGRLTSSRYPKRDRSRWRGSLRVQSVAGIRTSYRSLRELHRCLRHYRHRHFRRVENSGPPRFPTPTSSDRSFCSLRIYTFRYFLSQSVINPFFSPSATPTIRSISFHLGIFIYIYTRICIYSARAHTRTDARFCVYRCTLVIKIIKKILGREGRDKKVGRLKRKTNIDCHHSFVRLCSVAFSLLLYLSRHSSTSLFDQGLTCARIESREMHAKRNGGGGRFELASATESVSKNLPRVNRVFVYECTCT